MYKNISFILWENCSKCFESRSANSQSHRLAFEEDVEQFVSPQFIHKPRSLDNLMEGQNAHFEAKLEPIADPNLRVEWFLDGRPVTIGHRFRPIHDFGYVALDIVGLISEDSGTYTCRATNNVGSCECQVTLTCKSKFLVQEIFYCAGSSRKHEILRFLDFLCA